METPRACLVRIRISVILPNLINPIFRVLKKRLPDYAHYLVCDDEVIICLLEDCSVMAFEPTNFGLLYVSVKILVTMLT